MALKDQLKSTRHTIGIMYIKLMATLLFNIETGIKTLMSNYLFKKRLHNNRQSVNDVLPESLHRFIII